MRGTRCGRHCGLPKNVKSGTELETVGHEQSISSMKNKCACSKEHFNEVGCC